VTSCPASNGLPARQPYSHGGKRVRLMWLSRARRSCQLAAYFGSRIGQVNEIDEL
jgi:L-rhamnose isomerase